MYWENLKNVATWRFRGLFTLKYLAVNLCILTFAIFLTTPEVVQLDGVSDKILKALKITDLEKQFPKINGFIGTFKDFLPTLFIVSFTTFVPVMVSWSDRYLGKRNSISFEFTIS